jgi:nucleotide-binding universal stress UspA family protein
MKVLLPLDIVHPIDHTIHKLVAFVPLQNAEVCLLYVKEELPAYEKVIDAVGDFQEDWGHQIEVKAKAAFEQAAALLKPHCPNVTAEIVVGPPAMMIEAVARDEHFDMIALTPGTHRKVEMFLLGSVSSKVVKHGPATVLICRASERPIERLNNVIMGIDGSPQSRNAVAKAIQQFKIDPEQTRITLIHVVSVADVLKLVSPVEYISMVENNLLLEGETFLAQGRAMLSEHGFKRVDVVLKEGDPATEIIALSKAIPADLVVIGAQGRTAVQHFLLGSVSHRIAMHGPCSTAVVKPVKK